MGEYLAGLVLDCVGIFSGGGLFMGDWIPWSSAGMEFEDDSVGSGR